MINNINNATEFQQAISGSLTLIDFYADWCGPCRMLSPTLTSFAEKNPGKINVYKANIEIEDLTPFVSKYAVRGIPALFWFRNGEVVYSHRGLISEYNLQQITDSVLGK